MHSGGCTPAACMVGGQACSIEATKSHRSTPGGSRVQGSNPSMAWDHSQEPGGTGGTGGSADRRAGVQGGAGESAGSAGSAGVPGAQGTRLVALYSGQTARVPAADNEDVPWRAQLVQGGHREGEPARAVLAHARGRCRAGRAGTTCRLNKCCTRSLRNKLLAETALNLALTCLLSRL